MSIAALIVAAGRGTRLGAPKPKQYLPLGSGTVLHHTLAAFAGHPAIDMVQTVIGPDDGPDYAASAAGLDLLAPVAGGASRQESVLNGLMALAALPAPPDLVLIHDGARPFVDAAMIDAVIAALDLAPGALPALAVTDSLRRGVDGIVAGAVDRDGLYRAQTPQGFRFPDILSAHRAAVGQNLTDDVAVAMAADLQVRLVEGSESNFKITTQQDLEHAMQIVDGNSGQPDATVASIVSETRVGSGFDVHRYAAGRPMILCGVEIAHDRGLEGHSDADVGLHAITDAVLGAIAAGDIGDHFPPTDPQWKGAPSDVFLTHAARLVGDRGGRILSVDLTLICETPKIKPHRAAMQSRVAEILSLDPGRVSIKATTTERLGFTGRGEGIAAQAVASVALPVEAI